MLTLGNDPLGVAKFFDQEFAFTTAGSDFEQIPVTRLDISGYGTSMFSDWMDQDLKTIGVRRRALRRLARTNGRRDRSDRLDHRSLLHTHDTIGDL